MIFLLLEWPAVAYFSGRAIFGQAPLITGTQLLLGGIFNLLYRLKTWQTCNNANVSLEGSSEFWLYCVEVRDPVLNYDASDVVRQLLQDNWADSDRPGGDLHMKMGFRKRQEGNSKLTRRLPECALCGNRSRTTPQYAFNDSKRPMTAPVDYDWVRRGSRILSGFPILGYQLHTTCMIQD